MREKDNAKVCQSYVFLILPRAKDYSSNVQKRGEIFVFINNAKFHSLNVHSFNLHVHSLI